MSDEPTKTERKLGRTGSKQTLRGVVGEDVDDIDIFGYEVIYTTGEFTVDREALIEKAEEVGIPGWMMPSETRPHNAFGYAVDDLLDGREEVEWEGQRVQFVISSNDSRYSQSLDARVYFPPEMTSNDDGRWVQQELGVIKYLNPDEGEPRVQFVDRVDADESLAPLWGIQQKDGKVVKDSLADYDNYQQAVERGSFRARMQGLFEKHKASHRGKDVNNMTYYLVDQWTDSIRLRDACYFVPANHTYTLGGEEHPISDLIDAFSDLYDWLDEAAEKPRFAEQTEMNVIEIMDTERQREMVERKVGERLEGMAADLTETVLDDLQDEDTVASEVADEVSDTLDDLKAVAGEYDDLLDGGRKQDLKVQNAVKRAVRSALGDLDTDEAELVANVLEDTDAVSLD
jgi:hypothetical protein